jgi:hypothetical protein
VIIVACQAFRVIYKIIAALANPGFRHNDQTALLLRPVENPGIIRCLHLVIPNVNGFVSRSAQAFGQERRKRVFHQESHEAASSGSYRSRTDSAATCNASRISSSSRSG